MNSSSAIPRTSSDGPAPGAIGTGLESVQAFPEEGCCESRLRLELSFVFDEGVRPAVVDDWEFELPLAFCSDELILQLNKEAQRCSTPS